MPFTNTNSSPTMGMLAALGFVSAMIIVVGIFSDYSFLPGKGLDGFLYQIEYAHQLLTAKDWSAFWNSPLSLIHVFRYAIVWPFLAAENAFGPAGSLTMLLLLFWPLLIAFRPQRGDWRDVVYIGSRFTVLLLPLVVSGRTVLVAAGMGYLVSGIMMRPFSGWRMFVGCLSAILSSVSVLFSIGVLLSAGNWKDRSRAFYAAKGFFLLLVIGLLMPSLFAKAEGFSSGAVGYAIEVQENAGEKAEKPALQDEIGTGPVAALQRIITRSTVVESYRDGNLARLALYVGLFAAAWVYILWSAAVRHWHPMLVVLALLSTGIFLEGLALWPILLPLVWAYTGIVRTTKNQWRSTELRVDAQP